MISKLVLSGCILVGCSSVAGAQGVPGNAGFTNWPAGTSPQEVGKALADHFVTSPHQYTKTIHYSEVCTWYGALRFANLTHDDALRDQLIKRFEPLMPGGAEAERRPVRRHVDDSIFGVAPLEIARQTKDPLDAATEFTERVLPYLYLGALDERRPASRRQRTAATARKTPPSQSGVTEKISEKG